VHAGCIAQRRQNIGSCAAADALQILGGKCAFSDNDHLRELSAANNNPRPAAYPSFLPKDSYATNSTSSQQIYLADEEIFFDQ
jgi:hypothetical protein